MRILQQEGWNLYLLMRQWAVPNRKKPRNTIGYLTCNYEASPTYCTFGNSWSTPCREHSTCLYLCTVLLLRLVHET